ncbi:hypothetical protein CSPHI_00320 [Corynebacterium sphenisci DSM 44792]|uniref:Copper-containing nitrite reductase n=1 Tax=Corynebacterium sphenisci DSM 44792 TaxID=1437874 RepID=A0A1L7CV92_9CORY|nr:multicopper oxidase domain-containing protein [Corynebacterium sphenisci]APT89795.1 hypothetical protein CSPHI_00320 [Corynebacterium sphenisci DSM 44792]
MPAPSPDQPSPRASWHRRAGRPVRWWLAAVIASAFVHPFLDEGRWLMVHLFTLGAVTNSILIWGRHFTERLLHLEVPPEDRRRQLLRLRLLNAGILVLIVGRVAGIWPVTVTGAAAVGGVVAWHAAGIARDLRGRRGGRHAVVVDHYLASALLLPVGAVFGALLGSPADELGPGGHDGLVLAHEAVNLLGFLGLAAAGTLTTMFPALWRTRMSPRGRPRVALATMLAGIAVTAVAAVAAVPAAASAGLALVAAGWIIAAVPWADNVLAVARDPRDRLGHPALSTAAAVAWLVGSLIAASAMAARPGFTITALTLPLVIGFAAQLLIGVMGWLLPSTIGGGGRALAAGMRELDRAGAFRWGLVNIGLVLWLLPLPSWTKVAVSGIVGLALAAFLPLLGRSARAQLAVLRRPRDGADGAPVELTGAARDRAGLPERTGARRLGVQLTAATATLALVVGVGVALSGGGAGGSAGAAEAAGVAPTGRTVEATVTARDMRYEPDVLRAEPGDRLVITMVNADDQVHDLRLATGEDTGRVAPGESATVEIPVLPGEVEGWCTIAGHRQMGMTLRVDAGGAGAAVLAGPGAGGEGGGTAHPTPAAGPPAADSPTVDPRLPAAPAGRVHRVTLHAREFTGYGAPGVEQEHWTFGDDPLGPTLRGRVGDEFIVTLVNDGTMSHSVDFHAGMVSPDRPMRDIAPGESLEYRFRAEHAGIWLYHCGTAPMSQHIAAGMHGAVVIDPPDLAPVDHEVLLVQSEAYWGEGGPDAAKVLADAPDAYRFNGYPDQYLAHPIRIRAGETVRFWVLAAGPNRGTSFHVVGTQFHRMYKEGALLLDDGVGGAQALDLAAAQGGYAEARFPEPGTYTFVDHQMTHAELGARGRVIVE